MKKEKKDKNEYILGYRNEADRCYALAGMAISLASLDALESVASVSIDYPGPMVRFTGEFYFGGSPSVSPKATWHRIFEGYRLTSSLAIANVLARCLMRDGGSDPSDMLDRVAETIRIEGSEECGLEEDELDAFLSNTITRSRRIFANSRLITPLEALARIIGERRELSGRSLAEEMHMLRII